MEELEDYVKVAIRIRPSRSAPDAPATIQLIDQNAPVKCVLFVADRQQSYAFDEVFLSDASQEQVFERMIKPLVRQALQGYDCTVFAYGQTGTGKTYTIGSDPHTYKDAGFILRTLNEVFDNLEQCGEDDISISFFEIYNEKVFDLLSNNKAALLIKGFKIEGLSQKKVRNVIGAYDLLKMGSKSRHMSETKQNSCSSRSHAIFTIYCNVKQGNSQTMVKLNLVDLAGLESARKTGSEGSQFQEGININKGLFSIRRVINALSMNEKWVPHRESVITSALRDSLDKTNYITFIACVSPDFEDLQETVQTLEFVQEVKKLKNKPEINNIIQQHQKSNPGLFERFGSVEKIRGMPLKRHHLPEFVTIRSTAKKQKLVKSKASMPLLPNNSFTQTASSSLLSMSIQYSPPSKLFSTLPPLSPIVQKYTSDLKNHMQVFLQSHLEFSPNTAQNELKCSWQQLDSEVTHLVRSKLLFSMQRNSCQTVLSNEETFSYGRKSRAGPKKLEFDKEPACLDQTESEFKVPEGRAKKRKNDTSKTASLDETLLAEHLTDGPSTSFSTPAPGPAATRPVALRRSTRLSMKAKHLEPPQPTPRRNVQKLQTPIPAPRNRKPEAKEDPVVSHHKYILDILNTGSQKDLQKLPLVGPKTAAQIYVYRQLNGQFSSVYDLAKMESWRGSAYVRFLKANCLKAEED